MQTEIKATRLSAAASADLFRSNLDRLWDVQSAALLIAIKGLGHIACGMEDCDTYLGRVAVQAKAVQVLRDIQIKLEERNQGRD